MSTQSTDPPPVAPHVTSSFGPFARGWYQAGQNILFAVDEVGPIDPADREVEVPRGARLLWHLVATAEGGGVTYLTAFGRRVAAVVHPDVAESAERAREDSERGAGLRELLAEAQARLGPVPPDVQAEVDRQWRAALASM